ncbi:anti-sigma factor antagonist [Pseudonocardiaceae bacterium YIM PH 21723]|nr:anti-sigma factor antagonist [Pseudonocardiaceae bacterium YIM PH 21723]
MAQSMKAELFAGRGCGSLSISATSQGDSVVVHASGEVDLCSVPLLDWSLREASTLSTAPAPIVVDLSEVGFLNSSGINVLLKHVVHCRELGTPLRVVAASRAVRRPIELLGLGIMLPVFATVRAAVRRAA